MNVKKLLKYNATQNLVQTLRDMNSDNARIHARIQALEERLEQESKFLPNSKLWENAVQRLRK